MNLSYSQIDRKDLGSLWASIDWDDNRQLYLSSKDLSAMLSISVEDILKECSEGSYVDIYNINFVKVQCVIVMLKRNKSNVKYNEKFSRVLYWLENDILPSVGVMNFGTFTKL